MQTIEVFWITPQGKIELSVDRVLLCIFVVSLGLVLGVSPSHSDVSNTWRQGVVVLPGSATKSGEMVRVSGIEGETKTWAAQIQGEYLKSDIKIPAIIYLHGCGGYNAFDAWSLTLQGLGLAIFAPNSFARPGRKKGCWGAVDIQYRMRMRIEEVKFALKNIRHIAWIDQTRILLMGFSEGGHAVAEYSWDDFIAYLPIGTDCHVQGGGTYTPEDKPILNIVGSNDRYGYGDGCDISSDEKGSGSLVIWNGNHDVSGYPKAINAVAAFLDKCCRIKPAAIDFDLHKAADDMIAEFGELAPVFAFQKSEDAMNSGDVMGNQNWLKVRKLIYEKIGMPPG